MKKNRHPLDFAALTKPGITLMSAFMAAGGAFLAPEKISAPRAAAMLCGVALIVGAANAFNMVWERESDALMEHAKRRPLPEGRLSPRAALAFALAIGAAGLALLLFFCGALVAGLGATGMILYVLIYTPLKRVTPLALLVGALAGAIPPVIGWAAASGAIEAPALLLFFIMAAWQVPHFMAIAIRRKEDYARAGFRIAPIVHGDLAAKLQALAYSTLLVPASLAFVPMGVAGRAYFVIGLALGLAFFAMGAAGLVPGMGARWARRYYQASLFMPPALTLGLMIDRGMTGF